MNFFKTLIKKNRRIKSIHIINIIKENQLRDNLKVQMDHTQLGIHLRDIA